MKQLAITISLLLLLQPLMIPLAHAQDYRVGPDDVLSLVVWEHPEMTGLLRVEIDGTIFVPMVRKVKVDGLTVPQIKDKLEKALREYIKDPQVTVVVREYNNLVVAIWGAVKMPGEYSVANKKTLIGIISLAGGPTDDAALMRTTIKRNGRDLDVNVKFLLNQGVLHRDLVLQPGDVIYLPKKRFAWFDIMQVFYMLSAVGVVFTLATRK